MVQAPPNPRIAEALVAIPDPAARQVSRALRAVLEWWPSPCFQ